MRGRSGKGTAGFALALLIGLVVFAGLFALGYFPRKHREGITLAAADQERTSLPVVTVARVERAKTNSVLQLPGNVQAIGETPVYARAEGYITKRHVDIGDRVTKGQVLVEIEAPEIEQQLRQAKARVAQTQASLKQAQANLMQSAANLKLAEQTVKRWSDLVKNGILSKQEGDEKQAILEARQADQHSAQANIGVAEENIRAAEAEVRRLEEVKGFEKVTAPFDGVITVRNCAVGNLITPSAIASGRELFRLADNSRLRVFVNVPEVFVPAIRVGQVAELSLQEYPGRVFRGSVARLANALDNTSRTMVTEIQVVNEKNALLPGMFAQVRMTNVRRDPPLVIPGDTLLGRTEGPMVAIVQAGDSVHFQKIEVGRDYGAQVEVLHGLNGSETLIVNPGDEIREGTKVRVAPGR
jgi:RND family efflux transporter MFP subunit